MKVSKVDHTRAAVAVRNDMEPKGLLYKMPQGKIEENLYNRLLNRNEKNIEKYTAMEVCSAAVIEVLRSRSVSKLLLINLIHL